MSPDDIQNNPPLEFDFSIFHPLDHAVWDWRYCRSFYGGWQRHLELWWEMGPMTTEIRDWFWELVNCRRGKHDMRPYWLGGGLKTLGPPTGMMCAHCTERTPYLEAQ